MLESILPTILGNMFIFLLAGHEVAPSPSSCGVNLKVFPQTAAHTLCFTFALLALYPNEQERLYEHIKGVMSSLDRTPVRSSGPGSQCAWITEFLVDIRRHEPLYVLFSVSPLHQIVLHNEDSHMRIAFSTRLLGSCKFIFNFERYYHIVLTMRLQSPGKFDRLL
jgi:hypothetical protein